MKKADSWNRRRLLPLLLFISAWFLWGTMAGINGAFAGLVRVESETLSSARNADDLEAEVPIYEFVGASYVSDDSNFAINSNFSLFVDPMRMTQDSKLFTLDLTAKPIPDLLTIKLGRTFDVYRSVRAMTSDSAGAEFSLWDRRVTTGFFGGKERELRSGSLVPSANFWGAYASYRSSSLFPLYLSTKVKRRTFSEVAKAAENVLQTSMQLPLDGAWSPEVLVDSELHLPSASLSRFETGMDLYPNHRASLRWRVLTYNVRPEYGIEQPIFSIFSEGRLYEGMAQLEYKINPKLTMSLSAAYDDFVIQAPNQRTNGYRLDFDTRWTGDYSSASNAVYVFYSYGGRVYGDVLRFSQKLSDRTELQESAELTFYDKITKSRRVAISTTAGVNVWFNSRFRFNFGGEFNSNNILKYDVRVLAKLVYLLWTET